MTATRLTIVTFLALTAVCVIVGGVGGIILLEQLRAAYRVHEVESNAAQGARIASLFEMMHREGASEKEILDIFQRTVASASGTADRYVCIISNDGTLLCHPNDRAVGADATKVRIRAGSGNAEISYLKWIADPRGDAVSLDGDGQPVDFIHRVAVDGLPWQVIVHTRVSVIEEQARRLSRTIAMYLVPTLAAFVLMGTLAARVLGRRYEAAIEESNRALERRVADRTAELSTTVEELRAARSALLQKEKIALLGQLIAGIAHEISNPLAAITLHADTLEEDLERDEDRAALRTIGQSARRCAHLVDSLLAFARDSPPRREELSAGDIVESALGICAAELRANNIIVERTGRGESARIEADRIQMEQVVLNLVANASQAMAASANGGGRRLRVSVAGEGRRVEIAIADNGPGLPPQIREHLFEPFHTTKDENEGTGLGLSLCRRFVEHHGGTITYEDAPGGGALFRISLPTAGSAG